MIWEANNPVCPHRRVKVKPPNPFISTLEVELAARNRHNHSNDFHNMELEQGAWKAKLEHMLVSFQKVHQVLFLHYKYLHLNDYSNTNCEMFEFNDKMFKNNLRQFF